jgi:hypothetical protein
MTSLFRSGWWTVYCCGDHWHLARRGWALPLDQWMRDYSLADLELGTRVSQRLRVETEKPHQAMQQMTRTVRRKAKQAAGG